MAKHIYYKNGSWKGTIEDNGTIYENGFWVGQIDKDGTIHDKHGSRVGGIDPDGTIRSRDGSYIGSTNKDGSTYKKGGQYVGFNAAFDVITAESSAKQALDQVSSTKNEILESKKKESNSSAKESRDYSYGLVALLVILLLPIAIFNGLVDVLKAGAEVGIKSIIVIGYLMILIELIVCRFKWYGILCALAMFGALLQLPEAVRRGLTFKNVDKDSIFSFFLWFGIPIVIGLIKRHRDQQ